MVKRFTGTALLVCGLVVGIAGPAAAEPVETVTISQCVNAGGTAVITLTTSECRNGAHDGAAIRWH